MVMVNFSAYLKSITFNILNPISCEAFTVFVQILPGDNDAVNVWYHYCIRKYNMYSHQETLASPAVYTGASNFFILK